VTDPSDDEEEIDEGPEAADVRAGEIAVVPYPRVREQIGCGEEGGLVLEDRRSVVKVWFAGIDRSFWIERERLEVVPGDRLPLHPLVERLHRIARLVGAEEIDFYDEKDGVGVFHVYSRGIDLDVLLQVRALLGADLQHLRVDPGSIRRTRLTLAFVLPA
jgi:hypothetical protein